MFRKALPYYLFVVGFCLAYGLLFFFSLVPTPIYYPVQHLWSTQKWPSPDMGWYAKTLVSLAAGGVLYLLGLFCLPGKTGVRGQEAIEKSRSQGVEKSGSLEKREEESNQRFCFWWEVLLVSITWILIVGFILAFMSRDIFKWVV